MIRLYINYYIVNNKLRQEDYEYCLINNINNSYIDKIINISDVKINGDKIENINYNIRPTYKDFFTIIDMISKKDDINIISSNDIFYDESLKYLNDMKSNDYYQLCRYEYPANSFTFAGDMQDVHIFKSFLNVNYENFNFNLGVLGCDNKFLAEMCKSGYDCSNPYDKIKTFHNHQSNYRNRDTQQRVFGDYAFFNNKRTLRMFNCKQ